MAELRLPKNWGAFSPYNKLRYLVDTHQARDFSDAGRKLAQRRVASHSPKAAPPDPSTLRLPYADN